jgi:DNA-binding beta-propeller fold protein YncE
MAVPRLRRATALTILGLRCLAACSGPQGPGTGETEIVESDLESDVDDSEAVVNTCDVSGAICTVAGVPGTLGFNGEGLAAQASWLYFPSALAWSSDGQLLVSDFNNYRVRVIGADDVLSTLIGRGRHGWALVGEKGTDSDLENVVDISVGADGRMALAELHTDRVMSFESTGRIGHVAGDGEEGAAGDGGLATVARLRGPSGVAVGDDGRVYVSDSGNHVVRVVGTDGVIDLLLGDYVAGWADDAGRPRLNQPQRVRVDGERLLVADTGNHVVRAIDLGSGAASIIAGTGEPGNAGDGGLATDALLDQPVSAIAAPDGTILVVDARAHVVRRINRDGVIETIAGTGIAGLDGDGGPARFARLNGPADVVVGSDGAIYVADMMNGAVRRIAP